MGTPRGEGLRVQEREIFGVPGANMVFLNLVSGASMRFLEKPEAINGGVGKIA
jgi:hypothetical protein